MENVDKAKEDVKAAIATVRDFVDRIKSLRGILEGLEQEEGEFAAAMTELNGSLVALTNLMRGVSSTVTETMKESQDALSQLSGNNPMYAALADAYKSLGISDKVAGILGGGESQEEGNEEMTADGQDELRKQELVKEKEFLKEKAKLCKDNLIERNTLVLEQKKKELEILMAAGKQEAETEADFANQRLLKEKEISKAKVELAQSYMSTLGDAFSGMSKLFNSISDIYKNDEANSEKTLKKQKNLQIAGATMEMLSGVVKAVSGAMSMGPILGPIMGAINSATVIAAGIANIKKIKQTDTSGASSASAAPTAMASVAPPAVVPEVETVHNLTTSSDMAHQESMMKDQKVYILSSDLEANGKHVEIRERGTLILSPCFRKVSSKETYTQLHVVILSSLRSPP